MPAGHRVSETAAGVVTVVKDAPTLIRPQEVAVVETAVQGLPKAGDYRVVGQHDRIEVYEQAHRNRYGRYYGRAKGQPARYEPALRFVLIDPERRLFRADQTIPFWTHEGWLWLDRIGQIADLTQELVPALASRPQELTYSLDELFLTAPESGRPILDMSAKRGARRAATPPTSVHRLKVTLQHSRPAIWRRIAVPSGITLDRLHDVLQAAMGWDDEHLHLFQIDGMTFSDPRYRDADIHEEATVRLNQVAPFARTRFRYKYDFGDSWEHEIQVEAVQPPEPGQHYPACLAGERAAPPEDSGGVWRYAYLTELMTDPDHSDPEALEEFLEWMDGPFDPKTFDLDAVNRRLAKLG
ncbi:MAG: plasmid pRiA4b ORF-3 family protein [Thermomicrobiales bacterium]